jgi:hypothetical protein
MTKTQRELLDRLVGRELETVTPAIRGIHFTRAQVKAARDAVIARRPELGPTWKQVAARNINRLTPGEARATVERIGAEGATIFHPDVKRITGGFQSQSINFAVVRMLARRAGMVQS